MKPPWPIYPPRPRRGWQHEAGQVTRLLSRRTLQIAQVVQFAQPPGRWCTWQAARSGSASLRLRIQTCDFESFPFRHSLLILKDLAGRIKCKPTIQTTVGAVLGSVRDPERRSEQRKRTSQSHPNRKGVLRETSSTGYGAEGERIGLR